MKNGRTRSQTISTSAKRSASSSAADLLQEQSRNFLASSFILGSDADRGIITIVYKCSECGDTDTERLFSDKPMPAALCCVNCRAGFAVPNDRWGITSHPGMWPMGGAQELTD